MTTKEEALNAIEALMDGMTGQAEADYQAGILRSRLAELEAQVPRWIPTSERLPEKRGAVLVSLTKECGRRQAKIMFWNGKQFCYSRKTYRGLQVTHWMPVTEPCLSTPATEESTKDNQ